MKVDRASRERRSTPHSSQLHHAGLMFPVARSDAVSVSDRWFPVEQPDSRFTAEGRHVLGPFYRARVLDTVTGQYLHGRVDTALLTGRSSVRRAVRYGIDHYLRVHG
jgi:hypothetical protein